VARVGREVVRARTSPQLCAATACHYFDEYSAYNDLGINEGADGSYSWASAFLEATPLLIAINQAAQDCLHRGGQLNDTDNSPDDATCTGTTDGREQLAIYTPQVGGLSWSWTPTGP